MKRISDEEMELLPDYYLNDVITIKTAIKNVNAQLEADKLDELKWLDSQCTNPEHYQHGTLTSLCFSCKSERMYHLKESE